MSRRVPGAARAVVDDRRGATAVEYALLLGGVALASLAAVFALGGDLAGLFDAASNFSQGPG